MALYKITLKLSGTKKGVRLERGMSVDVASVNSNLIAGDKKVVIDAFKGRYGIDVQELGILNGCWLKTEKINVK